MPGSTEIRREHSTFMDTSSTAGADQLFKRHASVADGQKPSRSLRARLQALWISPNAWPVFYRSLASLFNAGIPLLDSFNALSRMGDEPKLDRACSDIAEGLREGKKLSFMLDQRRDLFPEQYRQMIRVGENTGGLSQILMQIAELEETRHSLWHRVMNKLLQPAIVLIIMVLLGTTFPLFIDRFFLQLFELAQEPVPIYLQVIFGLSHFLWSRWFWIPFILFSATFSVALKRWSAKESVSPFRRLLWKTGHSLRGFSDFLRLASAESFARTLSAALNSGVDLIKALQLSCKTTTDPKFLAKQGEMVTRVRNGDSLTDALRGTELFDGDFLAFVDTGEESGKLAELLKKIADVYASTLEHRTEMFLKLAEPFLLAPVVIVAGAFCLGFMIPLSRVIQNLA